ncbi:hypothetical protein BHU62_21200 [Serratia marcescens]|uniref:Peptidase C39-like domain-containing protein n=1 Tax=Serratia marcescens TaxID=615 RepID=A0A1Q4NV52_SERMA|nr:papain-like cysteine protease family protein [Serratia marcescens]OKB64734.1 hypothetical protein BHU62_21200 [Serratia marcescens]
MADNLFYIPESSPSKYEIRNFSKYFQPQQQSNWCWIATSVAVANYYAAEKSVFPVEQSRQCQVYADVVTTGRNACVENQQFPNKLPGTHPCNQTGYPDVPMRHLQIFSHQTLFSTLDPSVTPLILQALEADEPIVIGYNTGHAATLYGYDNGQYLIADPWYGKKKYSFAQLQDFRIDSSWLFFSKSPY